MDEKEWNKEKKYGSLSHVKKCKEFQYRKMHYGTCLRKETFSRRRGGDGGREGRRDRKREEDEVMMDKK